jgi:hypothetical protein
MDSAMQPLVLPYEKSTILNAIYDVADSLGLTISHVNSDRGVILLRTSDVEHLRVTVDTLFPSGHTKVGVEDAREVPAEFVLVLFDEISSLLDGNFHRHAQ